MQYSTITMDTHTAQALLTESTAQIDQIKPLLDEYPFLAQPLSEAKRQVTSAIGALRRNGDAEHRHLEAEYQYVLS